MDYQRSYIGFHTDWQLIPSIFHDLGNFVSLVSFSKSHLRTAINLCNNLSNFFFYRKVVIIQTCVVSGLVSMVLTNVSVSQLTVMHHSHTLTASSTGTSISAHNSFKAAISASVSVITLMATTAGMPNLRIFSTWRFKLAKPARTASTFLQSKHPWSPTVHLQSRESRYDYNSIW